MPAIASTHIRLLLWVRAVHSFPYLNVPSKLYIFIPLSVLSSLSGLQDGVLHIDFSGIQPIDVSSSASAIRHNCKQDWRKVERHLRWQRHAAELQPSTKPAFSPWAQEQLPHGRSSQLHLTKNICPARTDPFQWVSCGGALGDDAWRLYSCSAQVNHLLTSTVKRALSYRIPHGLNNKDLEGPRPVILVQHGLLCSSADWVISTPSKGLGN